jgi:hypothetical protein
MLFICIGFLPSILLAKNNIEYGGALIASDALRISAEIDFKILHEIRPSVQQGLEISPEIGINGAKLDIGYTRQHIWPSFKFPVVRFSGALSLIQIWGNNFNKSDNNQTYLGLHLKAYFLFVTLRTGYYFKANESNKSFWSTGFGIGI